MEVILYQTQDPWMDIGLVALYEALEFIEEEDQDIIDELKLTPGYLTFSIEDEQAENLREHLDSYIRERLNKVLLPSPELKLLGNSQWNKENERGFLNDQYKLTLSKDDLDFLKSKTNEQGKPYLKQPQKVAEVSCYRNFIGLKADWRRMTETYEKEIDDFIHQLVARPSKRKKCPLCGLDAEPKSFRPMNQARNPLFNQHHATPVRGYQSSVSKESMCPTCNLLNLLATLQVNWHPYFVSNVSNSQVTHLLVPEVTNLSSLSNLIKAFVQNGLQQNLAQAVQVISYQTNISKLRHRTLYVSLLQLYFWMNYVEKEAGLVRSPLEEQDRTALRGWLIPRYTKGQNVIFKEFTRLSTDEDLFFLTQLIPYNKKSYEGDIVHDFMNLIRSEDERLLNQIAEGIIRKDVRRIAKNIFQLYKQSLKNPQKYNIATRGCLFFSDYLSYLYQYIKKEEMALFSDQLHEDLRLLGKAIGRYTDLTAMNKLNTAATLDVFVTAVKEALFKIYKQQLSQRKDQIPSDEIHNIGTKRMQNILAQLDERNLFMIRDTLMIYASLAAFQANNKKNKEKESIEA